MTKKQPGELRRCLKNNPKESCPNVWQLANELHAMSPRHDLPVVPMLIRCVLYRSVSKGSNLLLGFKLKQEKG